MWTKFHKGYAKRGKRNMQTHIGRRGYRLQPTEYPSAHSSKNCARLGPLLLTSPQLHQRVGDLNGGHPVALKGNRLFARALVCPFWATVETRGCNTADFWKRTSADMNHVHQRRKHSPKLHPSSSTGHVRVHTCIMTACLSFCLKPSSSIFSWQDITCEWQRGILGFINLR